LLTEGGEDAGGPEDLSAERGQEQQAAHARSKVVLQRVEHGHVALPPHLVGEKHAAWESQISAESAIGATVTFPNTHKR